MGQRQKTLDHVILLIKNAGSRDGRARLRRTPHRPTSVASRSKIALSFTSEPKAPGFAALRARQNEIADGFGEVRGRRREKDRGGGREFFTPARTPCNIRSPPSRCYGRLAAVSVFCLLLGEAFARVILGIDIGERERPVAVNLHDRLIGELIWPRQGAFC